MFGRIWGSVVFKLTDDNKFPPTKSSPSFGPTLPDSKPLSLLEGIYNLSDNFTSSFFNDWGALKRKEIDEKSNIEWENLSQEEYQKTFKKSAIKRTKYSGITRNILFNKEN